MEEELTETASIIIFMLSQIESKDKAFQINLFKRVLIGHMAFVDISWKKRSNGCSNCSHRMDQKEIVTEVPFV